MNRWVKHVLLALLAIAIASACHRTATERVATPTSVISPSPCRTVQHKRGETCVPHNPQRVITLWIDTFSNTLALGIKPIATSQNLGEPLPKYLQNKVDSVESTGSFVQPSLEKILLLKPDLVLSMTRPYLEDVYTKLSNVIPTVVIDVPGVDKLSWQKHLEDVANILGREQEEKQLISAYWQRIEQLKQALGDRRHHLQVSIATIYPDFINVYGKVLPVSAVLNDLELQRPLAQSQDSIISLSQENLFDIDGDVLFLSYDGGETAKQSLEELQKSPLWQKLKVVQQNRVYIVDIHHWYAASILAMNAVLDDLEKYLINTP
ncbi:MAG: iron-siderophore ABC transporter substrate-binding protein [Leptolyngbyaceae cyanobacterium SU_3_3]|nr:iron-siderophore ABC transporter substrate-binding protein [Leptolyngbyaceae cyanobacterium SU_3_3]